MFIATPERWRTCASPRRASDHSYQNMMIEFEQAFARLGPGGMLLSDDIHLHAGWDDFCVTHGLRPTRIGHLGVARKRSSS